LLQSAQSRDENSLGDIADMRALARRIIAARVSEVRYAPAPSLLRVRNRRVREYATAAGARLLGRSGRRAGHCRGPVSRFAPIERLSGVRDRGLGA